MGLSLTPPPPQTTYKGKLGTKKGNQAGIVGVETRREVLASLIESALQVDHENEREQERLPSKAARESKTMSSEISCEWAGPPACVWAELKLGITQKAGG